LGSLLPAAAQTIRINCNGTTGYTASDGSVWSPDQYFIGGGNHWTSQTILKTNDVQLYRASRHSIYTDFAYDIPVTNGTYSVKLKFSENHFWGPGYRIFHVDANGVRVLANFDIAAAAGGARTAVDRQFNASVTNGRLRLDFIGVKERGMVSGIEVTRTGGATTPAPTPTPTPTPTVSLSISPASATLSPGAQRTFAAAVTGTTDTRVVWSLSSPLGSITTAGVYTAPSSLAQSSQVTVRATSVADSSKSATALITVATSVGISVSPSSASVISGNTVQFRTNVTGTSDTRVEWHASAGIINAAGLYTAPTVSSPTQVTITARSVADTSKASAAQVTVNPVAATPAPTPTPTPSGSGAWLESSGLVSIEAENGRVVNRSQSWIFRNNVAGYSGAGFMSAEGNTGSNANGSYSSWSPQVQFDVRFTRTGIFYIWVRGYGETDEDDSIHFGLDGAQVSTSETLSEFPLSPPAWGWSGDAMDRVRRITMNISTPGVHTINAFMREDGFRFDKLVMTTDANYRPSGNGPSESSRETGGSTTPVLSLSNTSVPFVAALGGSAPAGQTVGISNSGGGTLNWSAASNQGWLSVSPASGSGNGSVTLNVSLTGLAAGDHTAAVTVSAPGASSAPQTITVTLRISSTPIVPTLSVNPSSMSFNANTGSGATSQNATISFTGGSVGWSVSDNQPWLSVTPASGSGNGTLSVSANPSGLTAGSYTGIVTVLAAGATNSPTQINVSLNITNPAPVTSSGRSFYVATNGSSSNDGSLSRPWDLRSAMINTSAIRAGDTVWIRGGTYGGGTDDLQVKLIGTESAPVVVRAYPGERVIMHHPLIVGCCNGTVNASAGAHIWIWGIEFVSTVTDRTGCPSGPPCYASSTIRDAINAFAPGVKFINNIIHDAREGIAMWKEAINGEAYGNIIYNNGFHASDRGHGHGIYSQNRDGVKKMVDNILFNGFGYNFHMYGSGATYVKNFFFDGNVAFNAGILEGQRASNIIIAGGADGNRGIVLKDNHFYNWPDGQGYNELGWQWSNGNGDIQATNNYFIGGRDAVGVFDFQSVVFTGNTLLSSANQVWLRAPYGTSAYNWNHNKYHGTQNFRYGSTGTNFANWKSSTRIDANSTHDPNNPTGVWTFIRPNRCEAGRAHIIIYNWDMLSTVPVDLSGVLTSGMRFEIRDAQNFYNGPVVSGTYNGGPINIPMTGLTIDAPNGSVPYVPPHTAPRFGTFVVVVPGSASRTC
jgi:hypothetical protein